MARFRHRRRRQRSSTKAASPIPIGSGRCATNARRRGRRIPLQAIGQRQQYQALPEDQVDAFFELEARVAPARDDPHCRTRLIDRAGKIYRYDQTAEAAAAAGAIMMLRASERPAAGPENPRRPRTSDILWEQTHDRRLCPRRIRRRSDAAAAQIPNDWIVTREGRFFLDGQEFYGDEFDEGEEAPDHELTHGAVTPFMRLETFLSSVLTVNDDKSWRVDPPPPAGAQQVAIEGDPKP